MAGHAFTTDAPCFPLHAVQIEVPDRFDYAAIDFDRLVRDWNVLTPEMEEQRDAFEASMAAHRDRAKAAEWGCTVEELPWNQRKASFTQGASK